MKQVNLPDDLESPNDKFFTHPVVDWFLTNAGSTETVNWDDVIDNKNKENKYQKLVQKLYEITDSVVKKGAKGYFWLICSPQVSDMLATQKSFNSAFLEQFPLGYQIVLHMGTLEKRWRIYSDLALNNNTMLLGAGFSKKHLNYYCKINLQ